MAIGRLATAVAGAAHLVVHLGKRLDILRIGSMGCAGTMTAFAADAKLGKGPVLRLQPGHMARAAFLAPIAGLPVVRMIWFPFAGRHDPLGRQDREGVAHRLREIELRPTAAQRVGHVRQAKRKRRIGLRKVADDDAGILRRILHQLGVQRMLPGAVFVFMTAIATGAADIAFSACAKARARRNQLCRPLHASDLYGT